MSTDSNFIGQTIAGRYRIAQLIGRGGATEVYQALDIRLNRSVAIKMLHPSLAHDAEFGQRFQREIEALATLRHPHILTVYDYGQIDGRFYLVMEYVGGGSLHDVLARAGDKPLDVDFALEIVRQVGQALAYVHQRGMVHRDIKPSNILITQDGQALLSDLGLAIAAGRSTLTGIGTILGTPAFMSPEQVRGEALDARSDIYSLAILLYQLLTGRLPFRGDSAIQVMVQQVNELPPPLRQFNPALPQHLEQVVLTALAKDPQRRYQTADAFVNALLKTERLATSDQSASISQNESLQHDSQLGSSTRSLTKSNDATYKTQSRPWLLWAAILGLLLLTFAIAALSRSLWAREQPFLLLVTALLVPLFLLLLAWSVRQRKLAQVEPIRLPSSATREGQLSTVVKSPKTGHGPHSPSSAARERFSTIETLVYTDASVPATAVLRGESGAIAWLLALSGPHRGRQFQLADEVTIGRETGLELFRDDKAVSRQHARITHQDGRFVLHDLRSSNGTYVNGVRLEPSTAYTLQDRDEIRLGGTIVLFIQAVSAQDLTGQAKQRLNEFNTLWRQRPQLYLATNKESFTTLAGNLTNGLLREAIGYRVEYMIPYYKGIVGYMVEAPMLWIRHSRFPIFCVAYTQGHSDVLTDIVKQLELGNATEHFAILIVVPARQGTGNEAEELRHLVTGSVYRHDFVVLDRRHLESIIARNDSQRLIEIILEQGIELSSLSPYLIKGPVPENMFFGRENEIKTIAQTIRQKDYALLGGRRIGKSSTLLRLNRLLGSDPRFLATYLNCEEQFSHADFFGALADEFGQSLDSNEPAVMRKLLSALQAQHPRKQIVFLFDEVDQLLAHDAHERQGRLFRAFRALSHEGVCHFVFSGSRTLYQHLHDPLSPFFNFCQEMPLKPLEEKSVAEIIRKPMRQLGIELPQEEELIARIIDLTSCHPSLVQWLCDRLLHRASDRRITLTDLEAITAGPDFADYFVETAWGDATPLEKMVTVLVDGPNFSLDELLAVAAPYGIGHPAMLRDALKRLQLYALIEPRGQDYHFVLTQFPHFVRQVEDIPFLRQSLRQQVEV
jgi:serine/threonine protein kinase